MLLYFKTKTCIQIEHSNIKLIFITYFGERDSGRNEMKSYLCFVALNNLVPINHV